MQKLFLSIAEEDAGQLKQIAQECALADSRCDFYEGPFVPFDSTEADPLKRVIGEKISHCDMTVCFIGENTYKSPWVDCQLRKSRQKGNRIIAMALKGIKIAVLPEVVREENLQFYPWDPRRITKLLID